MIEEPAAISYRHANPSAPRRWLQFSLRRLLLTMFVVFLFVGYCADRTHRQRTSVEAIERLGGQVGYAGSAGVDRLADWVGRDTVARVDHVFLGGCPIADDDLACLAGLPDLDTLVLTTTPITDDGLEHLRGLRGLSFVDLRFTSVTAGGVERLRRRLPDTRIVYHSDID